MPKLFIVLFCATLVGPVFGQGPVVSWSAQAPQTAVAPGGAFTVRVRARILPTYHIYGLEAVQEEEPTSLEPTADSIAQAAGRPVPSRPPTHHEEHGIAFSYWEDEVTFEVPLRLKANVSPGEHDVALKVKWLPCTFESCLAPGSQILKIGIQVDGPAESAPGGEPLRIAGTRVEPVSEGRFFVEVDVDIHEGLHIFSTKETEEFATVVKVQGLRVDLVGPVTVTPAPELDASSGAHYHRGRATFRLPLGIDDAVSGETVTFEVNIEGTPSTFDRIGDLVAVGIPLEVEVGASGAGDGVPDPVETGEEGEAPTDGEASQGVEGRAVLDADPVPGKNVTVVVRWSDPSANWARVVVPKAGLFLRSPGLLPAGEGRIEAEGSEWVLRFPAAVKDDLTDGEVLSLEGKATLPNGTAVRFDGSGAVRQSIVQFLLLAMGAAALALLTPCVFPMIPITISFFTKQAEKSNQTPIVMSVVYCLGIIISFTAIGALFTVSLGADGAARFAQSSITLFVIAVLFIVFALSLFGAFELQLPAAVQNLAGAAQGKGGLLGVWLLGLLFAVTSFACTAPFVGAILAAAAASGNYARPLLGMVAFSGVLAVPFFFLSIFPSKLKSLPRAGGWLNEVKVVMGFIELAAAFKFLGDMNPAVFTRHLILCVWITLFVLCALYLLGVFRLSKDAPKERIGVMGLLSSGLFLMMSVYLAKGLSGEPVSAYVDAYLPTEDFARTPNGARFLLVEELSGRVAVSGTASGPAARTGYERAYHYWDKSNGRVADPDPYGLALAEAKRLKTALFVDFTGWS